MLIMKGKENNVNQVDRYRQFIDNWDWKTSNQDELKLLNELRRTTWAPMYVNGANEFLSIFSDDTVKKLIERRFLSTIGLLDGTCKTGNDEMKDKYVGMELSMDLLIINPESLLLSCFCWDGEAF